MNWISQNFIEHQNIIKLVADQCYDDIAVVGQIMVQVLHQGGTLLVWQWR